MRARGRAAGPAAARPRPCASLLPPPRLLLLLPLLLLLLLPDAASAAAAASHGPGPAGGGVGGPVAAVAPQAAGRGRVKPRRRVGGLGEPQGPAGSASALVSRALVQLLGRGGGGGGGGGRWAPSRRLLQLAPPPQARGRLPPAPPAAAAATAAGAAVAPPPPLTTSAGRSSSSTAGYGTPPPDDAEYDDADAVPYTYREGLNSDTVVPGSAGAGPGGGSRTFGQLAEELRRLINQVAAGVPRLGSVAEVTTAASGASVAQRRDTTVRLQLDPDRTGGFFTGGSAAVDPGAAATLAAGDSASVVKDLQTLGAPTASFGAAGQAVAVGRVEAPGAADGDAGVRSLVGGLSLAGEQAVPTRVTFTTGPVTTIFDGQRRTGSSSQNGASVEGAGQSSDVTVTTASLATYSQSGAQGSRAGREQLAAEQRALQAQALPQVLQGTLGPQLTNLASALQKERQQRAEDARAKKQGGQGNPPPAPPQAAKPPPAPGPAPPPPPPPYLPPEPPGKAGKGPRNTNAGGAAATLRLQHADLPGRPSGFDASVAAQIQTFGASNLFGWTRGSVEAQGVAVGTDFTRGLASGGAFGTGAASTSTFLVGVTPLQDVICLPAKPTPSGSGGAGKGQQQLRDAASGSGADPAPSGGGGGEEGGDPMQRLLSRAAVAPLPANLLLPGTTVTTPASATSSSSSSATISDSAMVDEGGSYRASSTGGAGGGQEGAGGGGAGGGGGGGPRGLVQPSAAACEERRGQQRGGT
ncbi:hypothetical protein HYH03_011954 [Edaphochlamys debaryana]|uniref:Uncharacterized protein n=1 Tax=Edaphochlamys debaryana TaxID=47281 RepID=A0A835XTQ6_9CHLO|nr:hypothetical protein HYH03_011954 [Edaphochlamys debaryana]|eukprot:KAG2489502.1 hypothetical protein HYH03_011954 [Edaphochlamys debaryana]